MGHERAARPGAGRNEMVKDDVLPAGSVEEDLRDFLAADRLDLPIDPAFRERLRRELWKLVEANLKEWRELNPHADEDEEQS